MTAKYKVGDLFYSNAGRDPDLAEIIKITDTHVTYRWMGMNGMPIYEFTMPVYEFEDNVYGYTATMIECNSEQQKLAIILKYS